MAVILDSAYPSESQTAHDTTVYNMVAATICGGDFGTYFIFEDFTEDSTVVLDSAYPTE